ncbi:MAG: Glyoxalase/Bleomycin resistance protein/Dioxygenase superfamily, partial [Actinomycetota bacterium]
MQFGYVVLYVDDVDACLKFWTEKVGMIEKSRKQAGDFSIVKIGFANQNAALELVPLELMKDNPSGLDLATPSIAFHVDDLHAAQAKLVA